MAKGKRRALRWLGGIFLVLVLLAAGSVYLLLQTRPGHEFFLRTALGQTSGAVHGELEVRGIRSDGLLRGFILQGVAIRDLEGRPFLEADSVQVGYSVPGLLRRQVVLQPTRVWRPRVTLEILHGDTRTNAERIFLGPEDPDPDAPETAPTLSVALRQMEIVNGDVVIRLPIEGEPDGVFQTETLPGLEGLYRVLRFTNLAALLDEATILDPAEPGQRFRFRRLAVDVHVLDEPFRVEEFRGDVERRGSRLAMEAERFWLTSSEISGSAAVDWGDAEEGLLLDLDLAADPFRLEDFRWLEPRLPDGEGRLDLRVEGPLERSRWRIRQADLRVGESRLRGSLGFDLGEEIRFTETDLEAAPFHLAELDPWLAEPLPVRGRLQGDLQAEGEAGDLWVSARLAFDDPARDLPASSVDLEGTLHLGEALGVTGLSVDVNPLRYPTLQAVLPETPLTGEGRLRLTATGTLTAGIQGTAELEHRVVTQEWASRVTASGSVREVADELVLDLESVLDPLSFDGAASALGRELPLRGIVTGPVRVEGPLSALQVAGTLMTPGGAFTARAEFDARDPTRRYRVDASASEFRLAALLPDLPDPTTLTGSVLLEGRGVEPETLEGEAWVEVSAAQVGGLEVERIAARLEAREGSLRVDDLEVLSSLIRVTGQGDLGLREGAPQGEVILDWGVASLGDLRPLVMEEGEISADTLTALERDILRMEGIDPDTLPVRAHMPMEGHAWGTLNLRGGLPDLRADGFVELEEAVYGESSLAAGRVDFVGGWARDRGWDAEGVLDLDRFAYGRHGLLRGSGEVSYEPGRGSARLDLQRDEEESYRIRGSFAHDTLGVEVGLETLVMDLDDEEWTLEAPARIRLRGSVVEVDDFRISGPAEDGGAPSRVEAGGTLDREGMSEFRVELQDLDLDRVARIARLDRLPSGFLDLEARIQGEAGSPTMEGSFRIRDFAYDGTTLDRLEGLLAYSDHQLRAEVDVDHEGRRLLRADGRIPVDLSLHPVEDRFPTRDVEIGLHVEEFPAATALAFLDPLEDVEGTLDGRIQFRGSPRDLVSSGELRLRGGALTLTELGLRTTGVTADLILHEDQTLEVQVEARSRGTARVEGTIALGDLADPGFDLRITATGFQAVDRRDLNARVAGSMTLTGSYQAPRVGGEVRVEQGVLFLDEFARTAQVVDLTDPAFFDVVDTTLVTVRPRVEAAQNPFLQNLRVGVDLRIQRDFWLRSREMNVEISGDLNVVFDRRDRELLLVGTLEAVRGSYLAFGRTFQVEGGSVDFMGTPGINPALDIRAVNRLRREGGELLNVMAQLDGTLIRPRVSLTSDAQPPIHESDLISYLLFGRPSYALASGETSVLEGAAGAGVQVGLGTVAGQLGAVVAREFGVDYFTITQTEERAGAARSAGLGGAFAGTQIEMGQYVGQNVFLALMLRPLTGLGASAQAQLPGARVEWRFSDHWTAEAFVEDRFAREGISGFGELGIRLSKVFGVTLFREWSY